MKDVSIIAFYSFFEIKSPQIVKSEVVEFLKNFEIKGTILIGPEGVNGTIAILKAQEKKVSQFIQSLGVQSENIKISQFDGQRVFSHFKIKIKKEIVTSDFDLSIDEIKKGKFVEPKLWDEFIRREDVEIIDTRNDYEFKLGHFKKAINPNIKSFKEFKSYIEERKEDLQNKKVAIYCTGGIRCEKAGPFMQRHGIDAYQLKGGVLKYFEETSGYNWNGECFVFDYRVSVDKQLNVGANVLCYGCNEPVTPFEQKSDYYEEGFTCPSCYKKMTEKKRRSLADKREHWKRIL